MKINLTLLLVIVSCAAFAQGDVSREELRRGFEQQYIHRCRSPGMNAYDKQSGWAGMLPCGEDKDYHWYIGKNESLRHAGRMTLPPSMYCVVNISNQDIGIAWRAKDDSLALYWIGSLNHYLEKDDVALRDKLKKIVWVCHVEGQR